MHTIETQAFAYEELNEEAKENAREWYKRGELNQDWHEYIYDDAKACAALLGINIDKIYFSGFYSQGDGACFDGSYSYKKGALTAIKAYAPLDTTLHEIARELQAIQKPAFYRLCAEVEHSGRYYHENCTEFTITNNGEYFFDSRDSYIRDNESAALVEPFMPIRLTPTPTSASIIGESEVL